MKDKLIKILNFKLKDIGNKIEELKNLNKRIEEVTNHLNDIKAVINLFDNGEKDFNIYNFCKVSRNNFDRMLLEFDGAVKEKFATGSCNYDGLIYLIDGINKGISLTLTEEQKNAIEFFINKLFDKEKEYENNDEELNSIKKNMEISDLNALESMYTHYTNIIEKLDEEEYVDEVDDILEAIKYTNVDDATSLSIFEYLLKYNADIYKSKVESSKVNIPFEQISSNALNVKEEDTRFHAPKVDNIDVNDKKDETFVETTNTNVIENEEDVETTLRNIEVNDFTFKDENSEKKEDDNEVKEYNPFIVNTISKDESINSVEVKKEELGEESIVPGIVDLNTTTNQEELNIIGQNDIKEEDDNEIPAAANDVTIEIPIEQNSSENLQDVTNSLDAIEVFLKEIDYNYDDVSDEQKERLLPSDIGKYKEIIQVLKDRNLYSNLVLKKQMFIELLLDNKIDNINNALVLITENIKDDLNNVIGVLPSILISKPYGNYDDFVKNIEFFKNLGIDINGLYKFSREILIESNDKLSHNYEFIETYNLSLTINNCKYYLMLNNIDQKIDYFLETNITDKQGKKFNALEFIKAYPSKLNMVSDVTIKRLRYSMENDKKIFGSKDNSLAGEITNLKVDVLNMPNNYIEGYFNNKYETITDKEYMEYVDLLNNNKNFIYDTDDLLTKLDHYRDGIVYDLNGIIISRNKVIRIYNTLVTNEVDKSKALLFAICYNAVINQEEYAKIKTIIGELGGM